MGYFAVMYDLRKANNEDYVKLWAECERMNAAKFQDSAYFFDYVGTCLQLQQHLQSYVDKDDLVMVIEFDKRPRYINADQPGHKWIVSRYG